MKNKKVNLLIVSVILITNFITYYITAKEIRFQNYINTIKFESILVKAFDQNKSLIVKEILINDINGLFIIINKEVESNKFLPMCKVFDSNMMDILKQDKYNNLSLENTSETKEVMDTIKGGKSKFKELCKKLEDRS